MAASVPHRLPKHLVKTMFFAFCAQSEISLASYIYEYTKTEGVTTCLSTARTSSFSFSARYTLEVACEGLEVSSLLEVAVVIGVQSPPSVVNGW